MVRVWRKRLEHPYTAHLRAETTGSNIYVTIDAFATARIFHSLLLLILTYLKGKLLLRSLIINSVNCIVLK